DHGHPTGSDREVRRRLDLRSHTAGRKLPVGEMSTGLICAHVEDRSLLRASEIDFDRRNTGHEYEGVGIDCVGDPFGGVIFVDHSRDPTVMAVAVVDDGDATATCGDDEVAIFDQVRDWSRFEDADRSG